MAKRKVKKSELGNYALLGAVVLGIAALVMIFLPAIAIKDSETAYTGMQISFGYAENDITVFAFSFMNLLTYILVIVGILFAVLGFIGKGGKFAAFIAAAAFIVAAIFFFLSVSFSMPNESASEIYKGIGSLFGKDVSIKDNLTLAIGSIIGAIASLLAGGMSALKVVLK